jgi:hypothetical protein
MTKACKGVRMYHGVEATGLVEVVCVLHVTCTEAPFQVQRGIWSCASAAPQPSIYAIPCGFPSRQVGSREPWASAAHYYIYADQGIS